MHGGFSRGDHVPAERLPLSCLQGGRDTGNGKDDPVIELLFVSCLSNDPGRCQDRSLTFVDMGLMACMIHGQQQLAPWLESHPRETVREWKCRMAGQRQAEA